MWSFATHAGAGIAVAGLSATYYALQRKNYELEREQSSTEGSSDADRSQTLMAAKGAFLTIPASQRLLRKQFDHLSRDSGHTFGLNVAASQNLIDQSTQAASVNQDSHVDIRQIISRVNTNFPKTPVVTSVASEDDLLTPAPEHPEEAERSKPTPQPSYETGDDSRSVFDVEEFSRLEMSEDDVVGQEVDKDKDNQVDESEEPPPADLKICHCTDSNETIIQVQRTKSPIVYYKNHGFGKRFACKIPESTPHFPDTPLHTTCYNKDIIMEDGDGWNNENYKDSTLFLFPPVLSDSKVSICGDEEEKESLEEDKQKGFDQPIDELDANALLTEGLSRMDEIRDYNLQLKVMHDVRKTQDASILNQNFTPIIVTEPIIQKKPSLELEQHQETVKISSIFLSKREKDNFVDVDVDEKYHSAIGKDIGDKRSSSIVTTSIPATSWVSLPARLYAEPENVPIEVIIFLALVVLVFGILGKFFITLSAWFEALPSELDEHNPAAMMEH